MKKSWDILVRWTVSTLIWSSNSLSQVFLLSAFVRVCPLLTNLDVLAFQMRNPAGYQAATTALSVDEQTLLMEVMRIADEPPVNVVA